MSAEYIGTEIQGFVHPAAGPGKGSQGELGIHFLVAGLIAGTVRIVWNPRARIKDKAEAVELVKMLGSHLGYIQQHKHPERDDPTTEAYETALVARLRKEKGELLDEILQAYIDAQEHGRRVVLDRLRKVLEANGRPT